MKNILTPLLSLFVLFGLLLLAQNSASAQGRGRGKAGGAGNPSVNRPSNPNVDFGQGNASRRSNGRSDRGLETAETRSNALVWEVKTPAAPNAKYGIIRTRQNF